MRGCDGKLCFSEKERDKVLKDYMERIINEENEWDCNVEGDVVEGSVVCKRERRCCRHEMKTEKLLDRQKYHWNWLLQVVSRNSSDV